MPCTDPRCGAPQTGPGHPRRGWVRVSIAGDPTARWYCSTSCAARGLGLAADVTSRRPDVGDCAFCVSRHDLGHACRSCGHRPSRLLYRNVGQPDPPAVTDIPRPAKATSAEIRAWANANGYDVASIGAIPHWLIDTYNDAHAEAAS